MFKLDLAAKMRKQPVNIANSKKKSKFIKKVELHELLMLFQLACVISLVNRAYSIYFCFCFTILMYILAIVLNKNALSINNCILYDKFEFKLNSEAEVIQ